MKDIKSLTLSQLKEEMAALGEKPFRAKQLYEWMHVKLARDYGEMTNIPKSLIAKCRENYTYTSLKEVTVQTSAIDGTKKFLFELADGNLVESVWMQYHHGNSVCISSQVGCRMGCRFCASTLDGLERSLLPGEMLDQIYAISRSTGERVSNVVVMGTGEPMDNYDNLLQFIRMLSDENGLNISQRNITVSTCGIVENMRRLADEGLQITLALSLHGSTQQKRQELMPIANKYDIHEVCLLYTSMYPPVANMLAVLILSDDEMTGVSHSMELADLVKKHFEGRRVQVIGPASAAIGKIQDIYRNIFYIKHRDYAVLVEAKDVMETYIAQKEWNTDTVQFDFNPMNGY